MSNFTKRLKSILVCTISYMLMGLGAYTQCSPDVLTPVYVHCPSDIVVSNDLNECQAYVNWNAEVIDQQNWVGTSSPTIGTDQWQSFTAGQTGTLSAFEVFTNGCIAVWPDVTVYQGVGTGGPVLYTASIYAGGSFCNLPAKIILTGDSKPYLIAGQQYTVRLQDITGSYRAMPATPGRSYYSNNYGLNPGFELKFRVYIAPDMVNATDNCNLASLNSNIQPNTIFPIGTTTVNYTATDGAGNTSTCSFNVTVNDDQLPAIVNVPANITVNHTPGQCGAAVNWIPAPNAPVIDQQNPFLSDATSGTDQWQSFTATKYGPLKKISLRRNGCGNTDFLLTIYRGRGTSGTVLFSQNYSLGYICTFPDPNFDINIPSGLEPMMFPGQEYTFRIQTATDLGLSAGYEDMAREYYSNSYLYPYWELHFKVWVEEITAIHATDNCNLTSFIPTNAPGSFFPVGTTTVTYTATDNSANTSTASFTVTVNDNQNPVPDVPSLPIITGQCSVTVTPPTATDNCGTITATTLDPTTYNALGTYTIAWKYTDPSGNFSTQNQTVIVEPDNTPPVADIALLPDITGECTVTVNTAPTATDNCDGAITATTASPTTYNSQGTYTVVWQYTDALGNSSFQNQTVVIEDVTAPVADLASLPTVSGICSVAVNTVPTATDNCYGTLITATTSDPTAYNSYGTYTVHWVYDDGHGNTSTQNQTVVVDDIAAPVPDLASLPAVNSQCSVTVTTPTATDDCTGGVNATTVDPVTYSADGTYTIHWIYDDGNGNTSAQNQVVTIDDNTAPVPDVPVLSTVSSECTVTLTAPTATDNCAGTLNAATVDPLTYNAEGTYTVHWVYDDGRGNSVTQNQTVIIDDVTDPIPIVASLPTVTNECSLTLTAPAATDNCAGTIIATTGDPTTYNIEGTYTVNWIYNDGNGNSTSQSQTVIIDDITAPVPALPSLDTVQTECSATVTAPAATDNCAGAITATTTDPTTYNTQGTFTVNWIYNDGHGNTSTQTQAVIVQDTTDPVTDVINLANLTGCNVTVTTHPTATDNCAGSITATTSDPLSYSLAGNYTITWIYTDAAGNTTGQTQNVQVIDCSGIENGFISSEVKIYPNPGNGVFTLSLNSLPKEGAQIRVMDELGQVLFTQTIQQENQVYDLGYLKAATYYVQVISEQTVITKILIITNMK